MKILVCSDTHHNSELFQKAVDFGISLDVTHLWHLGDDWDDTTKIDTYDLLVKQVPGLWHANYHNPSISRIYSFDWGVFSSTMVHDISTIRPMYLTNSPWLFFHGHTHKPAIEAQNNSLTINPGHLKKNFDRGYEATFLTITLEPGNSTVTIEQCHPQSMTVLCTLVLTIGQNGWKKEHQSGEWHGDFNL